MKYDLVITHIDRLLSLAGDPDRGLRGEEMEQSIEIEDAAIAIKDGRIAFVGKTNTLFEREIIEAEQTINARGKSVLPGFIDAHTHLPFYGWRGGEVARGRGKTYGNVIQGGGGIKVSIKEMEEASDVDILQFTNDLLDHIHTWGTTTVEMKSGYSSNVEGELRELHLIQKIKENSPVDIIPTCLAAHDVPEGYTSSEWINEVINDLLPEVAEKKLARMTDIYIEPFTFNISDARKFAEASRSLGLIPRAHSDQVHNIGGCKEAVLLEFSSADHLNQITEEEMQMLAKSNTAAGMLPGADFTMREKHLPPARKLIDSGALVVLSSNYNPGTSPVGAMPVIIGFACALYDWTPKEAIAAATINAAVSLGIGKDRGSIEVGKAADILILKDNLYEMLPYRMGSNPISMVIKDGIITKNNNDIIDSPNAVIEVQV
ncbi:imidazolonepropionase [Siminovitchia acidinfaciens]|uniref:Imidazolonepropionase n=1 Tax=Siminovitchia acidinfaciens TaxID=2321395 RepID=A0A429Y4Y8_9BACI|nr:imidazolonepropionase [Siminovitchia acidinfaciens]RST76496.1 imidazolonepropionase [Siminovitchia acidinfaciens]